jgi:hypothetical protein
VSTPSTLGASVPRSAHTNLDLMRDFGFIKEYVKGLGVIGTHVRTCRGATPRHSYRYSDVFVPLFGLIRTLSVLFARLAQAVRPAMAVPPGIRLPEGRYALRSLPTRCSALSTYSV